VLLDGVNHIAWISKDAERLKAFYAKVFDADVGPTRSHGDRPGETMTVIRIGPHTELNIFTIEGNTEPERQTPMWGRGRIDLGGGRVQRRHPTRTAPGAQLVDHPSVTFPRLLLGRIAHTGRVVPSTDDQGLVDACRSLISTRHDAAGILTT
jgi:hypothetical protein